MPPTPAPPLEVVEVPVVAGFVALLVPAVDEVPVLELLVELLELVEDGVVGLVDEVVVVRVVVELEVVQSRCASWLTVPAPWPRFCTSVVVTDWGRLATALVSAAAALPACPHWWDASAEEIEFS